VRGWRRFFTRWKSHTPARSMKVSRPRIAIIERAAENVGCTYPSKVALLRRFGKSPTPVIVTDPALDDDRLRRVRDEVVYAGDWRPADVLTQEEGEDWDRGGRFSTFSLKPPPTSPRGPTHGSGTNPRTWLR
jgi:hypothetical protein